MSNYLISGGQKLSGFLTTNTSKNAAVVLLNAALLNSGKTILFDVPKIEEVNRIIEVLSSIGVSIKWFGQKNLIVLPPKKLKLSEINYGAAIKTRSILFWLGVIIHRQKNFLVPYPGGCDLGSRTVKPHLFALENFGVKIKTKPRYYQVSYQRLKPGREIGLYESRDTVTENGTLWAAPTRGQSPI